MKGVQVNLLFRHPAQRHNAWCEAVHRCGGVGGQAKGSFNVRIRHVHQHRLSHVVEVVAQGNDVSVDLRSEVIDALSSEDAAV